MLTAKELDVIKDHAKEKKGKGEMCTITPEALIDLVKEVKLLRFKMTKLGAKCSTLKLKLELLEDEKQLVR